MRYVSIDLETTGLDENEHQIIEFGAIIEDSKNPKSYDESKKYRRIVLAVDRKYVCSSVAAAMNADLIKTISLIENGGNVPFENNENLTQTAIFTHELIADFRLWLLANGFKENARGVIEIVAAGKNFASFDRKFIQALPDFETYGIRFHHRSLDPTSGYINWDEDSVPPGTDQCKLRAGLIKGSKHEALADAWDVILLLRNQYGSGIDLRPTTAAIASITF
jgi:oligoribonuclease